MEWEGQQPLEVMLIERHGDADEHTDGAKADHQILHCGNLDVLEQRIDQTDDAIDAALGEDAGDHQGDGSGATAWASAARGGRGR